MDTTFKIRPNVYWHDGVPYSTKDVVLWWEFTRDPQIPRKDRAVANSISSIDTPDDRTLVLHWKQPYNRADALYDSDLTSLPRHILEDVYRSGNVDQLVNQTYWSTPDYVGTGPFRVIRWEPDVEIELAAFDQYYLGKPKVDRILWRFIFDTNTMLANVLSNNVDAVLGDGYTFDTALSAKEQWETRGEGTVYFTPTSWLWINLSATNPWFTDVRVHRALLHAIDRQEMVETLTRGLDTVAHIPLIPKRPQFDRALAAAMKYDYDPPRARQLLQEAGWSPGGDGVLVNARGERFSIEARTVDQQERTQTQTATVDYWKRVGVESQLNNMSARQDQDDAYRARWPGAYWGTIPMTLELWDTNFGNIGIPTTENRWVGRNVAQWDDPTKEQILTGLRQSFDPRAKDDFIVQLTTLFSAQLPYLPVKYTSDMISVRKGILNIYPRAESGGTANTFTWNADQWDKS
jgi:peptide/nickel transport system substrate-binding protein